MSNIIPFISTHASDIIFLGCVVVVIFIYGVLFSRGRTISLLLSLYPAALMFLKFPNTGKISHVLLFAIIFIALNVVLNKVIAQHSFERIKWFESLLLAISGGLLVAVLFYTILPLSNLYKLSPPFVSFFNNPWVVFIGLLLPFVALLYKHKD